MRTSSRGRPARALAALCLLGLVAGSAQAEERYWITEFGSPGATLDYWGTRLNASGQVAGTLGGQAVLFTGGVATPVSRAGVGAVLDLNDLGQVLGQDDLGLFLYDGGTTYDLTGAGMTSVRDLANGDYVVAGTMNDPTDPAQYGHAAIWYGGTVIPVYESLRPLGEIWSEMVFVNSWGEGVGAWYDALGTGHPFFVYASGEVAPLDPITDLASTEDQHATALNDNGMVGGFYWNEAGLHVLEYWWFGFPFEIAAELPDGSILDRSRGLNERNDTFGNATHQPTGHSHGYLFTYEDMTIREVASLGGDTCTHGINIHGDVIGHANPPGNGPYLGDERFGAGPNTLFTGGKVYDLNTLIPPGSGFVLSDYSGAINDRGQLLVNAWGADGVQRPILLTPLPVSQLSLAGTSRADGWYTSNVTATVVASDAVTGVREVHYRVDGGAWITATGTSASFAVRQSGTHRVSYYAVDAKGHAEATKTTTVSIDLGGVVVQTPTLPNGTVGTPFLATVAAQGGTAPHSFRITAGSLPAGLTLAQNGTIQGTPTAAGLTWFQVQASDARGLSSRSFLSIEVLDPLVVTTPAEVSATAAIGLTATGGKGPYTWEIDPTTPLPAPLSLFHATIGGGTQLALPPTNVTVVVTDAVGQTRSKSLSLGFVPPIVVTFAGGETTVPAGAPVNLRITTAGGTGGWYWHSFDPPLPEGLVWGGTIWDFSIWGSVATPGTYTFGVIASDGYNTSAPTMVTLTVQ